MSPDTRTALLAVGAFFCVVFAVMTVVAIGERGFDAASVIALLLLAMIAFGLYGAIRNPPG